MVNQSEILCKRALKGRTVEYCHCCSLYLQVCLELVGVDVDVGVPGVVGDAVGPVGDGGVGPHVVAVPEAPHYDALNARETMIKD